MRENYELTNRYYYLDWLRVIAIMIMFFYHGVHFFDTNDWSVKNQTTYQWVSWLMGFLGVWLMPLFFLISGFSIFYAIRKAKPARFIHGKVMRLLVPLIVGIFTFSIMQVYLERIFHGQFNGSFFNFIPHYFEGLYMPGGTGNFAFHGMHLWYLLFLFIYTIIFMPLFWWLKGEGGSRFMSKLGNILSVPGALLLFLFPTIIIQNLTNGWGILESGGWRVIQYAWFLIAGYLIAAHQQIQSRIVKDRWVWLAITLSLIALSVILHQGPGDHPDIFVWFGLFAIQGFAMKKLNFSNKFLAYSNEAVMPFYILHQNILLLFGFFIIEWPVPDTAKFILIVITTLLAIMVLYEYFIRRYNSLRIIFGMKPVPKNNHNAEKYMAIKEKS